MMGCMPGTCVNLVRSHAGLRPAPHAPAHQPRRPLLAASAAGRRGLQRRSSSRRPCRQHRQASSAGHVLPRRPPRRPARPHRRRISATPTTAPAAPFPRPRVARHIGRGTACPVGSTSRRIAGGTHAGMASAESHHPGQSRPSKLRTSANGLPHPAGSLRSSSTATSRSTDETSSTEATARNAWRRSSSSRGKRSSTACT
mmetsp:Transcript_114461/g.224546  ORF Transcript_114461/g.224546 Transcript_114461/m.224546 type:complete len:200 (-) Transcript_114461:211-810(-)